MLLCQLVGSEHKAIGNDSSDGARHEASPEPHHSILQPDCFRTIKEPTIGDKSLILAELTRARDLKLSLDDVLRIRDKPTSKATNTSR